MTIDCNQIVRLNVGGTHYNVSYTTLERCEGAILAKLAGLVADTWNGENDDCDKKSVFIDCDNKPLFIDRNGRLFEYVLDYLQTNQLNLPSTVSQAAVKEELQFYGIDVHTNKVNERPDPMTTSESSNQINAGNTGQCEPSSSDFDSVKARVQAAESNITRVMNTVVLLNVGGTRYDVTYGTLKDCDSPLLAKLAPSVSGIRNDEKEALFIDRNGRLFENVLDYLRTKKLHLPSTVSRDAIQEEFQYFGIDVDKSKTTKDIEDRPMIDDLGFILAEKLALQVSAFVEYDFIRRNLPLSDVKVVLPTYNYSHLQNHVDLLQERLLARGLEYISSDFTSTRAWVSAKKSEEKM